MAWTEAYLRTKCHLNPSNRLATIQYTNVTDRQTERQTEDRQADKQRSDSIGGTVLQTVAKNWRSYTNDGLAASCGPNRQLMLWRRVREGSTSEFSRFSQFVGVGAVKIKSIVSVFEMFGCFD